jgi:osomolarity two-component system, sensor histidine kinase CHK1
MGYTADHAKDGVEALEHCERAALADSLYDVILLDIQMPNMDVCPFLTILTMKGYEATRILRERYDGSIRPTLVALTANATDADKARSLEVGLDTHLSKPILPEPLAEVLEAVQPKRKKRML